MTAVRTLRTAVVVFGVAAVATLGCVAGVTAQAQSTPVYRCGNVYTQWPCSQDARALPLDAPPDAASRQSAARTAADEARWAERLRVERLSGEVHARPALAVAIGPALSRGAVKPLPRRASRHGAQRAQPGDQGVDFVAGVPAPPKARKAVK